MGRERAYEFPELAELGAVEQVTRGSGPTYVDACGCAAPRPSIDPPEWDGPALRPKSAIR
jgi:hypothetical protein